jgi:hypothetical protein
MGVAFLVLALLIPLPGSAAEDNEFEALLEAEMPDLLDYYGVPDLWPTIGSRVLLGTLMAWIAFRLATAFFPHRAAGAAEDPGQPSIKHATHQANDCATSSPGPVSPG